MKAANLTTTGNITDKDRKTTVKTRVITDNKHQLRIDEEDTSPIINENEILLRAALNNIRGISAKPNKLLESQIETLPMKSENKFQYEMYFEGNFLKNNFQ